MPALDIAIISLTVGIVSVEVLAIRTRVQGTKFVTASFVVRYMVLYPAITVPKEMLPLQAIPVVSQARQLLWYGIVGPLIFTISQDISCFVIAVSVDLVATADQIQLHHQQPLHFPGQLHLHHTWYVAFNCSSLQFYSRTPNNRGRVIIIEIAMAFSWFFFLFSFCSVSL